jgi:ABC-type multidrug transport system ATPase subunit
VSVDFDQLEFIDVSRSFGRRKALSHVSLTCRAGEVVGLLGPNGSGKSTLLSIAATLMSPSGGEVRYGGRTAREAGVPLRSRLGLLAHDLHLYPELTARENLTFFAGLYGLSGVREQVDDALARAALGDRADDVVAGFSRGMRQRLALERALLHRPRLLLLDEPFTGLDDTSGQLLIGRLKTLKAAGCLVLLATHDLDLAGELLDRAVILRDGKLIAVETETGGLRDRYRASIYRARGQGSH